MTVPASPRKARRCALWRAPAASRRAHGFTLVELMVVIAVAAVLAVVAVPSFRDLTIAQQARAAASAVQDSLWFARSEAIKRNGEVGFTLTSLDAGWEVVPTDSPQTVLRRQDPIFGLELTFLGNATGEFRYNAQGRLVGGAVGWRLQLSGPQDVGKRCISFDHSARPKMVHGACT